MGNIVEALSPSRAKDFMQCPKLFHFKTVLGISTPSTAATVRGTLAHYAFEHVFNHEPDDRGVDVALSYVEPAWRMLLDPLAERSTVDEDSPEFRLRLAEGRFRDVHAPGSDTEQRLLMQADDVRIAVVDQDVDEFLETVRRTVVGWYAMENPAKFTPAARERYVRAKVGRVTVHGYIDRFDEIEINGKLRRFVSDYKGLALDTPLPTPSGWTTMGDVQVGDWLLGGDGRPVRVVEKTPTHRLPCYRVRFDDGGSVVADMVHLWLLDDGRVVSTVELAHLVGRNEAFLPPSVFFEELDPSTPSFEELEPVLARAFSRSTGPVVCGRDVHAGMLETFGRASGADRRRFLRSVASDGRLYADGDESADLLSDIVLLTGGDVLRWEERPDDGMLICELPLAVFGDVPAGRRQVMAVEPVEPVDTACVRVESPNTYLVGSSMVVTHNTGRKPSERFADEAFFQLEVYALALREGDAVDVDQLRLIYTSEAAKDAVLTRRVDAATLERTKKKLQGVWDGIGKAASSGVWPTRRQKLCDWCHFKPVCPAFAPELEGLLPEEIVLRLHEGR